MIVRYTIHVYKQKTKILYTLALDNSVPGTQNVFEYHTVRSVPYFCHTLLASDIYLTSLIPYFREVVVEEDRSRSQDLWQGLPWHPCLTYLHVQS